MLKIKKIEAIWQENAVPTKSSKIANWNKGKSSPLYVLETYYVIIVSLARQTHAMSVVEILRLHARTNLYHLYFSDLFKTNIISVLFGGVYRLAEIFTWARVIRVKIDGLQNAFNFCLCFLLDLKYFFITYGRPPKMTTWPQKITGNANFLEFWNFKFF